jgi:hypothetical protein
VKVFDPVSKSLDATGFVVPDAVNVIAPVEAFITKYPLVFPL